MSLDQIVLDDYYNMCDMIRDIDYKRYDNIIIIGHIPIVSIKEKTRNGVINCVLNNSHLFTEIFDILIEKGVKKIYYVCADTHNFEYMTFNYRSLRIEQIISGTGGAILDTVRQCNIATISNMEGISNFKLLKFDSNFGYTVMDINDLTNNIKIEFIKFDKNPNANYDQIESSFN
jgi:hypothetical protein